jgi:hypothetical protein
VAQPRADLSGGAELVLLVLACTEEDTTAVDLASGALIRLRVPWPVGHQPELAAFDVIEVRLADDPETDDLAQPEAATVAGLPRRVGTLHGRQARRMLQELTAWGDGPLLGFAGPSAPYWEFQGERPSAALVVPNRGPEFVRRTREDMIWVRFGWEGDDIWMPVESAEVTGALDASRRDRLWGRRLASRIGFRPYYLLACLTQPRDGYCLKVCTALLPRD